MHGILRARVPASLAFLTVVAALFAQPAVAARNLDGVPGNLTESLATPSFLVHYTSAPGDPNAIAPAAAQQLSGTAERALGDLKSRLGFPQPMDDGDGKIDLYVYRDSDLTERGLFRLDSRADQASGWIAIPPDGAADIVTVAHQVFHLQQATVYRPAGRVLAEGGATWASLHLYAGELRRLPDEAQYIPDDPIDCSDPARCTRPGTTSWQFFELLAERFGPEVMRRLYDRSRALGESDHGAHFRQALDEVLMAEGKTLPSLFADFTRTNLVGGYALPGLVRRRYAATEPRGDLPTGSRTRRFRARVATLDHLSSGFYRLRSGSDAEAAGGRCRRATLTVTITGPVDLEEPVFLAEFRPKRRPVVPVKLGVTGKARRRFTWSTCGGREVGVAVHNPSGSIEDRVFTVTAEVKVGSSKR